MSAVIIASGNNINKNIFDDENIDSDFVICADGGLEKAEYLNLMPDVIIGDFDSVNKTILEKYKCMNVEIIKYPQDKDYTDMELSIEYAIDKGFKELILLGATGTRLDHTLANISLIERYYKNGINIKIIDNNNKIQIAKSNMEIYNKKNYFVSVVAISEYIEGLTLEGFKYPLNDVTVKRGSTLCISNEITEEKGKIKLKGGTALIFISKD